MASRETRIAGGCHVMRLRATSQLRSRRGAIASHLPMLVTAGETYTGGKSPHRRCTIKALRIEERRRGTVRRQACHLEKGCGMADARSHRREREGGAQRGPASDAKNADIGCGTRGAKEIEEAL